MTVSVKRLWLGCLAAGIATVAIATWFRAATPAQGCGGPLEGTPPLLAFQFARSPDDLLRVFGSAGTGCRAAMVAAIDRMDTVDLVAFIPAYGLFLLLFLLAIAARPLTHLARLAIAALLGALAFDVMETATQLRMTRDLDAVTDFRLLAAASTAKFMLLGTVALLGGLLAWGARHRIAGVAMLAGGGWALVALALGLLPMLAAGHGLAWIAALALAMRMSLPRRSGSSQPTRA
jgi:hypothetical protein